MTKSEKYIFSKSENDIYEILGFNRTPIIKIANGKIVEPKEINLEGLTFKKWIIKKTRRFNLLYTTSEIKKT